MLNPIFPSAKLKNVENSKFNKNHLIYKEISYLKLFDQNTTEDNINLFKYIDFAYEINEKNSNNYDIYIINGYLKENLRDNETRLAFTTKIKKSERYSHYLSLFKIINFFKKQNITHLDIKPENIMIDKEISDKKNDFNYKNHRLLINNTFKSTTRFSN